jgi:hypothetical protein
MGLRLNALRYGVFVDGARLVLFTYHLAVGRGCGAVLSSTPLMSVVRPVVAGPVLPPLHHAVGSVLPPRHHRRILL